MDKINRALVKSQAKELIREKIFSLFVISAIVVILTNISVVFNVNSYVDEIINAVNANDNYSELYDFGNGNSLDDYDEYDFGENPLEDFEFNSTDGDYDIIGTSEKTTVTPVTGSVLPVFTSVSTLVGIIFIPMTVTLYGFYVSFIKRRPDEELNLGQEIAGLFKKSYDGTALKKFVIVILRELFMALWSLLFIIPGIIYYYRSYFAYQIMCEYPNLKPTEALKLSDKMVKGNKGELFLLDLSFFWWYCLVCVTAGIASIYVMPYVQTTQALYYENFRLRALQEGRLTEEDFLSEEELKARYTGSSQPGSYYNPADTQNNYYQPQQDNNYYTNTQPNANGADGVYYYTPKSDPQPQPETQAPPQESYYQPKQQTYYEPAPEPEEDNNNEE